MEESAVSEGQKVLVVDDEPHILRSLATYLEMENFDVTTASSGLEAIERAKETEFDLVVSDVRIVFAVTGALLLLTAFGALILLRGIDEVIYSEA